MATSKTFACRLMTKVGGIAEGPQREVKFPEPCAAVCLAKKEPTVIGRLSTARSPPDEPLIGQHIHMQVARVHRLAAKR